VTRFLSMITAGPPVLVVLRATSPRHVIDVAAALVDCGLSCLEVALTTPDGPALVRELRERHPRACIGAGTVLGLADVETVAEAGAEFVVCPNVDLGVGRATLERGLGWIPGAATPTEVVTAHKSGADAVKLFPASTLRPVFVSALREILPDVALVPTGGVDDTAAPEYLNAGATAVGVGGWLVAAALEHGDPRLARERAKRMLAAVGAPREEQ
jgi:2-dehydro-3-deoxyphosphogluconate aldolase/(4S)-4-hydroxy-2-oxoglutarate aldolase